MSGDESVAGMWVHNVCFDDKPDYFSEQVPDTQHGHPVWRDPVGGEELYRAWDPNTRTYRFFNRADHPPSPRFSSTPRIGHPVNWDAMSAQQRRAFQHSYTRHGSELGLPNWRQGNAEELRVLFNERVASLRSPESYIDVRRKPFNGASVDVNYFKSIENGIRYYYYETLDGVFISAGESR